MQLTFQFFVHGSRGAVVLGMRARDAADWTDGRRSLDFVGVQARFHGSKSDAEGPAVAAGYFHTNHMAICEHNHRNPMAIKNGPRPFLDTSFVIFKKEVSVKREP